MITFALQDSQKGAILVIGMLLLLILTMIGITAMNATSVSEKLTQNLRDTVTSFDAAESALGAGEAWILNQTTAPAAVSSCSTPPCTVWQYGLLGTVYQQSASWWQSQATPYPTTYSNIAAQPCYVIEQYGFVASELSPDAESQGKGYYYYRVTAQGTGTVNGVSYVQSIYVTQFN